MFKFFTLALVIIFAIAIPSFANPKVSSQDLAAISECTKPFREKVEKTAIIQIYDGPIYQIVRHGIDNSGNRSYMPFLVKIKDGKCDVIYSSFLGQGEKISDAFSGEFGRVATRNHYRYLAQARGKKSIQKWLDSGSNQLNEIEKTELKSLGFKIR